MRRPAHSTATALLILLMALPLDLLAQAPAGNRDWSAVAALASGSKVEITLKSGAKTKGALQDVSETGFTLSDKARSTQINRDDIFELYVAGKRSLLKPTAIGAGAGAAAGAVIGAAGGGCDNFCIISRGEATAALAAVGAIVGAVTGLTLGLVRHKKMLIYQNR